MAKKKNKMSKLDWTATIIVLVGALNWGLAVFDFNLVTAIFGSFANWVYGIVGLSAVYSVYKLFM